MNASVPSAKVTENLFNLSSAALGVTSLNEGKRGLRREAGNTYIYVGIIR